MTTSMINRLLSNMDKQGHDPFSALLDEYLLERAKSPKRLSKYSISMAQRPRPAGRLSPSGLGGCQRQAVFAFTGMKRRRRMNLDLELIFENGNWLHHKWQALFLDMERVLGKDRFEVISIESTVAIPRLRIAGSLDAHLRIMGIEYIMDIKSINDYGWGRVQAEGEAVQKHREQLQAYMRAKKVRRGFLLYDNKNNSQPAVFMVEYDDAIWNELVEWCRGVLGWLDMRRVPPRDQGCQKGSYMAKKCDWAWVCYGNHDMNIRKEVYKRFESIEAGWKRGNRIVRRWERERSISS